MRNKEKFYFRFAVSVFAVAAVAFGAVVSVVARESLQSLLESVTEFNADHWRHAPVDYGPGPGRGRPPNTVFNGRSGTGRIIASPQTSPPGVVSSIFVTNGGNYDSVPACTISAPRTPPVSPAVCTVYALEVSNFTTAVTTVGYTGGSGYSIGDTLLMNPMPGLTCSIYPATIVSSVTVNGAVNGLSILSNGVCSAFPSFGSYAFSGGEGSGFSTQTGPGGLEWRVRFIAASATGYVNTPLVTISPSPYGTATATATITPASGFAPVPVAGPAAPTQGVFGSAISWPINAIHTALLPDGRLLNYGSDQNGNQTAAFLYDVWDPSLGTGPGSHFVLPNTTGTDIFCAGTSVMWTTGQVLLTGGDLTVNGVRNYANNKVTFFNPGANSLTPGGAMNYPRWYATIVPLPNGQKLVVGGITTRPPVGTTVWPTASTPEIYNGVSWSTLPAVSTEQDWYYPRAYVAPSGNIFQIKPYGDLITYSTTGTTPVQYANLVAPSGSTYLPSVMFAPGEILSVRVSATVVININGSSPTISTTASLDQLRYDGNATLLADGTVFVNGGSSTENSLTGAAYDTQIWNPASGQWTTGATAAKPRLYHSTAILLPDGTVLTAGGGSPGPVVNLNAEIYYPSYLYMSGGTPAARPVITSVDNGATSIGVGQVLSFTMGDTNPVSRVTLVRAGAASHANNAEQRFFDLSSTISQNGQQVSVTLPSSANVLIPGYYLLFAFNQAGVPSIAPQVLITD
jgi:hypothetical protein